MGAGTAVRRAGLADVGAIAFVHVESWRVAHDGLLPRHVIDGLSVQRRADGWREMLTSGDGATLVATDNASGRVVGFINVGPSRDDDGRQEVGELRASYLHPGWWTGAGRQLHDAGLGLLAGGFREATLWVLDTNTRARTFYQRRGWRTGGLTKREEWGDLMLSQVRYRRAILAADDAGGRAQSAGGLSSSSSRSASPE